MEVQPGKTNGPLKPGGNGKYRNKRSVWNICASYFKGAHFAVFPEKLAEPCILAGCPEGGTVLDPFAGSGTTGVVLDMDLKGWFPVFRSEPVSYVRELVEEVQNTEEYIAAEMAAQLKRDEAAEASAPAPVLLPKPEQVEVNGGQIAPHPEVREKTVRLIHNKRLPYPGR